MSRYGDTPEGMVESCMEFLRICVDEQFTNVVISIKASNTVVMVKTVRLLVEQMGKEGMAFPLHLGVTEAGDGEDGRIKSALGIGALLCDGLGDTIRVSLSEAPEAEIPVARKLVDYVLQRENHPYIPGAEAPEFNYTNPSRRKTTAVGNIGGEQVPVVISARLEDNMEVDEQFRPDYIYCGQHLPEARRTDTGYIVDANIWNGEKGTYPAFNYQQLVELHHCYAEIKFLFTPYMGLNEEATACLRLHPEVVIIAQSNHPNRLGEFRGIAHQLMNQGLTNPLVFSSSIRKTTPKTYRSNRQPTWELLSSMASATVSCCIITERPLPIPKWTKQLLAFYRQAEHVHRKQNIFPVPVADVHYTTWKRLLPVSKLRPLT